MLFAAQDPSPNCPSGLGNSSQRMKRLAVNSGLKVYICVNLCTAEQHMRTSVYISPCLANV